MFDSEEEVEAAASMTSGSALVGRAMSKLTVTLRFFRIVPSEQTSCVPEVLQELLMEPSEPIT
jgi:hypothetical protein